MHCRISKNGPKLMKIYFPRFFVTFCRSLAILRYITVMEDSNLGQVWRHFLAKMRLFVSKSKSSIKLRVMTKVGKMNLHNFWTIFGHSTPWFFVGPGPQSGPGQLARARKWLARARSIFFSKIFKIKEIYGCRNVFIGFSPISNMWRVIKLSRDCKKQ